MKNLLKVTGYTLATALVMVASQASAFAAGTENNSGSLSAAQVVGGLSLLIGAILIPTIKKARKEA